MARIPIVSPETARGVRRLLVWFIKRRYGGMLPGIMQVVLPDLKVTMGSGWLYNHLHLSKSSRLTRLQREMLATVVNGKIGGAP